MSDGPQIIAHRGASFAAPENTLAAFRRAIGAGADGVEFDVRLATDGVPVVIHDATLGRTAARRSNVADVTSDELARLDAGSWFNRRWPRRQRPEFSGETVPTLAAVLDLYEAESGPVYIELKYGDEELMPLVEAVCGVISRRPMLPRIIVKSFRHEALSAVRRIEPSVETAALFEPTIMNVLRRRSGIIDIARGVGARHISLHRSLAGARLCERIHDAGMSITVWTTDDPKWIERCRRRGIHALIANDVERMLAARAGILGPI